MDSDRRRGYILSGGRIYLSSTSWKNIKEQDEQWGGKEFGNKINLGQCQLPN